MRKIVYIVLFFVMIVVSLLLLSFVRNLNVGMCVIFAEIALYGTLILLEIMRSKKEDILDAKSEHEPNDDNQDIEQVGEQDIEQVGEQDIEQDDDQFGVQDVEDID